MTDFELNVGACIYCGDKNPPLTREHILPRGLGGNQAPTGLNAALVLQKATCEQCRLITSRIEEACLRPMMDYARARLGLKRKDRSAAKMEMLVDLPDGSTERRDVDADEVLGPILVPCFYEAGVLTNKPITDETAPCDYHTIIVAPAHKRVMEQAERAGVELYADSKVFAQMLAKIALGVAVARFGVTGFEPTVRNLILNNQNEYGHWVGGFAGTPNAAVTSPMLHRIHLKTKQFSAGTFIVVEIQLFAEFGGPTNYVIVGRPL